MIRPGNELLTDRHRAAARWLPTTVLRDKAMTWFALACLFKEVLCTPFVVCLFLVSLHLCLLRMVSWNRENRQIKTSYRGREYQHFECEKIHIKIFSFHKIDTALIGANTVSLYFFDHKSFLNSIKLLICQASAFIFR